jgi:hypothetical protein
MRTINTVILFITMVLVCQKSVASDPFLIELPKVKTVKSGLILGLQNGKYTAFEIGGERHWKKLKIKNPTTVAVNAIMEYQFKSNVFGIKPGIWVKTNRLGFTYGSSIAFLSDFEYTRWGIAPQIGFRFLIFHGLVSYNATVGPKVFEEYNKLNVALRVYLNKDRKVDIKRKK